MNKDFLFILTYHGMTSSLRVDTEVRDMTLDEHIKYKSDEIEWRLRYPHFVEYAKFDIMCVVDLMIYKIKKNHCE